MNNLFTIDLIICTYNNAPLLKRTLATITQLIVPAYINWGLLVINNNCTDETASVVDDFIRQQLIPIRMVIETRQGITPARFCGVKNTGKEWIAFIDDDCILAEDWLIQAEQFMPVHPQCGLFGSRIKLLFEKEPPAFVYKFPFAYAGKNHGDAAKRMDAVAGAGMVVNRKALERCGWTDHPILSDRKGNQLISGGDMEIALRVGAHSEVWYNPLCKLDHIIPERRTTKEYLQRMLYGLGASRHNVTALLWKGSYLTWLPYTFFYAIGMFGMCTINGVKEIFSKEKRAGFRIAFSPFFGWNAGIGAMLGMKPQERNTLLGAVKRPLNKPI